MAYTTLKELDSFRNNLFCCFCKQNSSNELLYGKIYQFGDIITHYFCMLFSSQMEQKGNDDQGILGFMPADIKKELTRGRKLTCVYCHLDGATINCYHRGCKKRYHFPCSVNNGALHRFYEQFRSVCCQHRKPQAIPSAVLRSVEKFVCPMCQEVIKPKSVFDNIWAPCCKKVWFHRLCVQKMAVSAGYFFKCPNCNDKDKFRREMLECGIYIPDQDASWELEPNAFHELNERYNHCDAGICRCPRGRAYSSTEGDWEIALCSLCGSQGIHESCGQGEIDDKDQWTCSFCASVVSKMPPTVSNSPGPSVVTYGSPRRRGRRAMRKRDATQAETKDAPTVKILVTEDTPEDSNLRTPKLDNTQTSTTCLYDNGGQAIHVVKLDSIETNGDKVIEEIGGVNIQNIIILDSGSDDDEDLEMPKPKLPRLPNPSVTTIHSNVIELSDSDDESETTNQTNSSLPTTSVDDDDDVVFMGTHLPAVNSNENVQTPAMIRIVQNDNVLVLSPAEIMQREAIKQRTSITNAVNTVFSNNNIHSNNNGSSTMIWQSVPRHKSMVHSVPQSLDQGFTPDLDKNYNHVREATTPKVTEQRWIPKIVPNGIVRTNSVSEPVTNGCVDEASEIINLD